MTAKHIFVIGFLLLCNHLIAQNNAIELHEVVIADSQLRDFSTSQSTQILNDSVIRQNAQSLTALLNYNSSIYFKENGPGMVSSPSFRGTSAQQTAVIWNGININSQFNGQTDFNAISSTPYNSITIRSGGGSVIYGSSAIGGTVHLQNDLRFKDHFRNRLHVEFGSYSTSAVRYDLAVGSEKWTVNAALSRNQSDNDFEIPGQNRKNSNGQYKNVNFNVNAGFAISARNVLKFYNAVYDGARHFSLLTPSDTKTKYADFNTRNLVEWSNVSNAFTTKLKAAYLTEHYRYFSNIENDMSTGSTAKTAIIKYDGTYEIGNKIRINGLLDYTNTVADGSDILNNRREILSTSLLFKHQATDKFLYELGVRKEATSNYDSPLLFSAGGKYSFNTVYAVRFNASRNFRIPTFNDLYWYDGGNPNLKPESSYQAEIGNEFTFKNAKISVTGYYMSIRDMIQWLPGTTALWFPDNVANVTSYGIEANANYSRTFYGHNFSVNGNYAYTVSENTATGFQLIYVPFHKATASASYSYKRFSAHSQFLFTGAVFTMSDNNRNYTVDPYAVTNLSIEFKLGKQHQYFTGARVLNLFDQPYEVVQHRPFPGRNFSIYLTLNL